MATNYFYHLLQELTLKFYMLASPAWPTHCLSRPGIKFCLPLACWMTLGNLPTFSVLQFSLWKQRDASPHFDNLMGKLNEVTLEKCEGHTYLYQILPATVLGKFFSLDFHDNRHSRFSSYFSGYSFAVTLQAPPPLQNPLGVGVPWGSLLGMPLFLVEGWLGDWIPSKTSGPSSCMKARPLFHGSQYLQATSTHIGTTETSHSACSKLNTSFPCPKIRRQCPGSLFFPGQRGTWKPPFRLPSLPSSYYPSNPCVPSFLPL